MGASLIEIYSAGLCKPVAHEILPLEHKIRLKTTTVSVPYPVMNDELFRLSLGR
jgi:hypothetical protein